MARRVSVRETRLINLALLCMVIVKWVLLLASPRQAAVSKSHTGRLYASPAVNRSVTVGSAEGLPLSTRKFRLRYTCG